MDGRAGAAWRAAKSVPVTMALCAVCSAVFVATLGRCAGQSPDLAGILFESLWSLGACTPALEDMGAMNLARVWVDGQWWRVGTTGLVHGSWIHVILNTWSLFVVGSWVERAWGGLWTAAAFGLCSLAGCLASLAWAEAPMVVGASAGAIGLAGILLVGRLWGDADTRVRLRPISARGLGIALAVLLAIGFFVPVIAQAGHIGGLVCGGVLGLGLSRGALARVLAVGASLALLTLGVFAGRSPRWRPNYDEFVGYRLVEVGREADGMAAFERALERAPDDPSLANAVAYSLAKAGLELDRAETLVQRALHDEPENADYLDTLGWIYCRRGDADAGLAKLAEAEAKLSSPVAEIRQHIETCRDAAAPNVPRETSPPTEVPPQP